MREVFIPKKVSQLTREDRANLTNAFQVLAINPTNYELFRVPVTQFRGASVFTSENPPSNTPEDPLIPSYITGDVFIQDSTEGKKCSVWDNVNVRWESATKLNGMRLLSASDFPEEVNLDLKTDNFVTDLAYENDYYLNKTLNLLFGPYNPTTGFKFEGLDFTGYQGFRSPVVFKLQGSDLDGYRDIKSYIKAYYDGVRGTLTQKEKRSLTLPIHQEGYHLELEGDEGHGGWVWYFDTNRGLPLVQTDNFGNLEAKLGADPLAITDVNRYYFREPKNWNEPNAPVQNNKKYRQGDNVFVTSTGILFYNYQDDAPDNTTDLSVLFEGQTLLSGSSLRTSKDVNGDWIDPIKNGSDYKEGDYILTKTLGTPRIHGPYKFDAADDEEAWPFYTSLRAPVEHRFDFDELTTSGFELPLTYTTPNPVHTSSGVEVMVVDGDKALLYYSPNKQYALLEGVKVGYSTDVNFKTLNWGDFTLRNPKHNALIETSSEQGFPLNDKVTYYNRQIIRNSLGDFFQFSEDFNDHTLSVFNRLNNLRASVTHYQQTDVTSYFAPDTIQASTDWGGSLVSTGDTLRVEWTTLGSEKVLEFTAQVDPATEVITWVNRKSGAINRRYIVPDYGQVTKGRDFYTQGDEIVNASGWATLYDEVNDLHVDSGWTRPSETFSVTKGNDYIPELEPLEEYTFLDTSITQKWLKIGDRVLVNVAGSTTGKQFYYDVVGERPAVLGVKTFSTPPRTWASVEGTPPVADDLNYREGDFIDNSVLGYRYGPYVEGAASDTLAWPVFTQLAAQPTYVDATLTNTYEMGVDDDEFYFLGQ